MSERPLVTLHNVISNVVAYLPSLLAGLVVLLLGLFVAWAASRVLVRVLVWLRLDRVIARLGWGRGLEKGDVRHALFEFVGTLVGGLIFLVFLDNALVIWQLAVLSRLLERVVFLVPELVVAGIIMLVGLAVATAVGNRTRRALHEEEIERAGLVARFVRASILVLTTAMALVQLRVALNIVTYAFLMAFGALAASFVLAFGLGSRRAVEMMWEEIFESRRRSGQTKPRATGKS